MKQNKSKRIFQHNLYVQNNNITMSHYGFNNCIKLNCLKKLFYARTKNIKKLRTVLHVHSRSKLRIKCAFYTTHVCSPTCAEKTKKPKILNSKDK